MRPVLTTRLHLPPLLAGVLFLIPGHPAARATHYRIDVATEQVTDPTALGGTEQRQALTLSSFVTITLADSAGGQTMDALVDSLRADSLSPIPPQSLVSASGVSWHATVGPTGKVGALTSVKSHPVASIFLEEVLARFYPRTAGGATTWTDTLETSTTIPNGTRTTRTVTNYQRSGAGSWGGDTGQRILSSFSSGVTASQSTPQGNVDIEGTASGSAAQYLASDGLYLGGTTQDSTSLVATGSFMPQPLPITITTKVTVTVLH